MWIRDKRLYKDRYATFEEYCQKRWEFTRAYASNLISAANAADNLSTMVDKPTHESQVRPLTALPPAQPGMFILSV
jgi:hypothetical protein